MNEALRPTPLAVPERARRADGMRVFRNGLLFMAAVGTAVLLWQLSQLLLLLFACGLVAMMMHQFAVALRRWLKLPRALAFAAAVILPILFIVSAFTLFGATMADQFEILIDSLPAALGDLQAWLATSDLGRRLLAEIPGLTPGADRVVATVQTILSDIGTVLSMVAIILVGGIYLAAQPRLYRRTLLAIVPPEKRLAFLRTSSRVIQALNSWLKAQGVGMAFVGVATGIGLSLVGIPGAPAIGLVAGLCEFVPYLGTVVVAIPSIIIGFSQSPETGIWTVAVLVAVQQVQGNLISPLAQSRMADLPPALTIFSLVVFGLLMGPLGVILAVPLTVVGYALVRVLVVEARRRPA